MKFSTASEMTGRPGPERRSEARLACNNTPAEVRIVSGIGNALVATPAIIVEVSRSGLRFSSDMQIGPGQQVLLKMKKLIIFGEVRHSRAKGATFVTGIKITEVAGCKGVCDRLTDEQIQLVLASGPTSPDRVGAT